jgi:predicted phage tail protein
VKLFAVVWIVLGAVFVAAAAFILLAHAAGPASGTLIATFGCIGVPFLAFGVWGLYQELKPYHYERRPKQ